MSDKMIKGIIVGPRKAGKTALFNAIANKDFTNQYKETLGGDYHHILLNGSGRKQITLELWDTGPDDISPLFTATNIIFFVIPSSGYFDEKAYFSYLEGIPKNVSIQIVVNKIDAWDREQSFRLDPIDRFINVAREKKYSINEQALWVDAKSRAGIDELNKLLMTIEPGNRPSSTMQKNISYKASYDTICYKMAGECSNEKSAIALLRDYSKGTSDRLSPILVLLHGHFKRHHTSVVRKNLRAYDKGDKTIQEVIEALNAVNKNSKGSLANRLNYIKENFPIADENKKNKIRCEFE